MASDQVNQVRIKRNNAPLKLLFLLFALVLVFVIFSGCIGSSGSSFTNDYFSSLNRTAIDNGSANLCPDASCWCMVCKNGTKSFFPFMNESLAGGSCYFDHSCDQQRFTSIMNGSYDPSVFPWHFMIGQGPDFVDTANAQLYCSDRLTMAVQWLTNNNMTGYEMPAASRATCLLSNGIMPLYILYSQGHISQTMTRAIAHELGSNGPSVTSLTTSAVGPVIITTELNFDSAQASDVVTQINAINQECDNLRRTTPNVIHCFIAVAPKLGDTNAMSELMRVGGGPSFANQFDLIAMGVNSHDLPTCNPWQIMQDIEMNASYYLENYGKPTVIPYVLFDSSGTSGTGPGACQWNEQYAQQAYQAFFSGGGVTSLAQRGVIGIAPYAFNSTHLGGRLNPLNCTDCDLAQNIQRMNSWFGGCQAYTNITRVTINAGGTNIFSRASPGTLLVFPNASSGVCDFNAQYDYQFRNIQYGDAFSGTDFVNPAANPMTAPLNNSLLRCDACVATSLNRAGQVVPPFDFRIASSGAVNLNVACNSIPQINNFASERNIDPTLLRAKIARESGFNPCDAARVCSLEYKNMLRTHAASIPLAPGEALGPLVNGVPQETTPWTLDASGNPVDYTDPALANAAGCFAPQTSGSDECYDSGYDSMYDPSGICHFTNAPGVDPVTGVYDRTLDPNTRQDGGRPEWRWCALGLQQSLEPPYTFWPASLFPADGGPARDGPYSQVWVNGPSHHLAPLASLQATAACGDHYNPFNATMALCYGSAKMAGMLRQARGLVAQYHSAGYLNWGADNTYKDNVFAAYIAMNIYSGFWYGRWTAGLPDKLCQFGTSSHGSYLDIGSPEDPSGPLLDRFNGDCWVRTFYQSWSFSCPGPSVPPGCSAVGVPLKTFPFCNGFDDPIEFIQNCMLSDISVQNGGAGGWLQTSKSGTNGVQHVALDRGAAAMATYFYMLSHCSNVACPDWKPMFDESHLEGITLPAIPHSGNIYYPDPATSSSAASGTGTGTGTGTSSGSGTSPPPPPGGSGTTPS